MAAHGVFEVLGAEISRTAFAKECGADIPAVLNHPLLGLPIVAQRRKKLDSTFTNHAGGAAHAIAQVRTRVRFAVFECGRALATVWDMVPTIELRDDRAGASARTLSRGADARCGEVRLATLARTLACGCLEGALRALEAGCDLLVEWLEGARITGHTTAPICVVVRAGAALLVPQQCAISGGCGGVLQHLVFRRVLRCEGEDDQDLRRQSRQLHIPSVRRLEVPPELHK
mmetsp:Transcript_34016/g.98024  ORF Transcript_34016/g.98024 Transcript_34016/m.98024 type:complete len:230 (-) Transcript_34016:2815-3504(-)